MQHGAGILQVIMTTKEKKPRKPSLTKDRLKGLHAFLLALVMVKHIHRQRISMLIKGIRSDQSALTKIDVEIINDAIRLAVTSNIVHTEFTREERRSFNIGVSCMMDWITYEIETNTAERERLKGLA